MRNIAEPPLTEEDIKLLRRMPLSILAPPKCAQMRKDEADTFRRAYKLQCAGYLGGELRRDGPHILIDFALTERGRIGMLGGAT